MATVKKKTYSVDIYGSNGTTHYTAFDSDSAKTALEEFLAHKDIIHLKTFYSGGGFTFMEIPYDSIGFISVTEENATSSVEDAICEVAE